MPDPKMFNILIHHPECKYTGQGDTSHCPCGPLHLASDDRHQIATWLRDMTAKIQDQLPGIIERMDYTENC